MLEDSQRLLSDIPLFICRQTASFREGSSEKAEIDDSKHDHSEPSEQAMEGFGQLSHSWDPVSVVIEEICVVIEMIKNQGHNVGHHVHPEDQVDHRKGYKQRDDSLDS